MLFRVSSVLPDINNSHDSIVLVKDNWDDWFQFETKYIMYYIDDAGIKNKIGSLKIGQKEMGDNQRSPILPEEFEELPSDCFSLGQSDNYYDEINHLGDFLREKILMSLHDIAFNEELYNEVKQYSVTRISLMREITDFMIKKQFRRIAHGGARLTKYEIEYTYPFTSDEENTTKLFFSVVPESNPPTNIQVIIGRNNVGKTYLIKNIINSIYFPEKYQLYGRLRSSNVKTCKLVRTTTSQAFANILCVSFSPFDNYNDIIKSTEKRKVTPFKYIGLTSDNIHESLKKSFADGLMNCLYSDRKIHLLKKALTILETDVIFERSNIISLLEISDNDDPSQVAKDKKKDAITLFEKLSSGHQVIALILVQIIEKISERTLVILDEPENHLHPPLLSAFIRALSELLIDRNGVALIATHSPVILQEVPKKG